HALGSRSRWRRSRSPAEPPGRTCCRSTSSPTRSEEHTSELQSQSNLVCRLLLEKKKTTGIRRPPLQHHACIHPGLYHITILLDPTPFPLHLPRWHYDQA